MKKDAAFWLSICVAILVWLSACIGLFYSDGGKPRLVDNIHGEAVELFGDGVYANNSMLKATTAKGTDLVMCLTVVGLLAVTLKRGAGPKEKLLRGGFLVSLLYYSANTVFGIAYNRLFLLYAAMFSAAFFAFVFAVIDLCATVRPVNGEQKCTGTAIFTMLTGCTTLVWLMSVLPTLFTDAHLDVIGVAATEPTFAIDMGLIFPTCLYGGAMLLKRRPIGYILPPVMLTFLVVMAVTVIGQTAMQLQYGVIVTVRQIIGYVLTFIVFGFAALFVNTRFLCKCWPGATQGKNNLDDRDPML